MAVIPLKHYSISHNIAVLVIVSILYFLAGQLGIMFALPGTNVTPIWIPSGIALALIMLYGYRVTIAVFFGSFFVNILTLHQLFPDINLFKVIAVSFFTGIGAALQAAAGYALINHYILDRAQFFYRDRTQYVPTKNVFKFILIVLISCFISSTIGTSTMTFSEIVPLQLYPTVWWTWWAGDTMGILLITPLIFVWTQFPFPLTSLSKTLEACAILFAFCIVGYLNATPNSRYNFLYFPCIVWSVCRFQFHGATVGLFLMLLILTLETIGGLGYFVGETLFRSLLHLAIYTIIVASTTLVLAAELSKRTFTTPTRWAKKPKSFIHSLKSTKQWWKSKLK